MVNLKEKFENLDLSNMALDIVENYDDYLCDAISEVADQNVDYYNSDLVEWLYRNDDYVNEAVKEFGVDERNFDIWAIIRQGQYYYNEQELYKQTEQIWLGKALYYLMNNDIKGLDEEIYEKLVSKCNCMHTTDEYLHCITEWCNENILNTAQQ